MTGDPVPVEREVPRRRRRRWPALLALALAALALPVARAAVGVLSAPAPAATVEFTRPLAIPPLAESRIDEAGRRVFDLRLQPGTTDFGRGSPAGTWGVNQSYLGPTVRARRGEQVLLNVANDLGEATTLHWHGMHLPARMDGGPHQVVEPGEQWSPSWTVDQPAATLWYHPHLHGSTAEHVYRGLAGMFIVDDDHPAATDLPQHYGVDDVPVIVQDKSFTDDGQLDDAAPSVGATGFLGDTVLVNGTAGAYREVTTERVRLRLLNASNARIYDFGFDDGREFGLVGTDGGLLPAPAAMSRVRLSPGERAEVVVAVRPAEDVVLRSYPPDLGADWWNRRFAGGNDAFDVLQLRPADRLEPSPPLPARLASPPGLDPDDATTTRRFELGGTDINDRDMDLARIDETVTVGDTELWEVRNAVGTPHNFHVHDVRFRVVDTDGRPPPPALSGWKDTVYVAPGTTVRLLAQFADYTDPDVPYMFHCHLLRHEDSGMMGQFVVVAPGQRAGTPPGHHGGPVDGGDASSSPEHGRHP